MPANTSLADLTATQAIAMLCARDTTAVMYAQALFDRFDAGGYECLNAFISLNRTQVRFDLFEVSRNPVRDRDLFCDTDQLARDVRAYNLHL